MEKIGRERRAAQYIALYVSGQSAEPPFESWEVELHEPPPRKDPK
jgi:hypothetical protein